MIIDAMMLPMRTTVTLDVDTRLLVERAMRERGITFKQALNEAIRAGLGTESGTVRTYTVPRPLGPARIGLDRALRVAEELEDDALAHRLAEGR